MGSGVCGVCDDSFVIAGLSCFDSSLRSSADPFMKSSLASVA